MVSFFPSRAVAVDLFGLQIHWYGVMYLLAFVLTILLVPNLQRLRGLYLTRDEWLNLISWGIAGVIIGGRLGFVLFYEPSYFAMHPWEIPAVWQGGMSFHGGFLGVVALMTFACYRKQYGIARVADILVAPAAIGLALGRIGNFINLELYGTRTDLPWAISIPGVEGLRHPTQIYEALGDLSIALICFAYLTYTKKIIPGRAFALFMMLYGVVRFSVEFVREQQYPVEHLGILELTRGQLLTIPVFLFGLLFWLWLRPDTAENAENKVRASLSKN